MILLDTVLDKVIKSEQITPAITIFLMIIMPITIIVIRRIIQNKINKQYRNIQKKRLDELTGKLNQGAFFFFLFTFCIIVTLNNSFLSNLPIALSAKKNKGASHGLFFDHLVSLSYWQNLLSNWLKSCCTCLIYCHLKDSREPIIYQNHK